MKKKYVKIDGIHCEHCIDTITNELLKNKNIERVIIKNNIAHISYNGELSNKEIIKAVKKIDFFTIDDLDNLTPDGCNPIGIEERTDEDGKITIGTEQLNGLKDKFENWKGPKVSN